MAFAGIFNPAIGQCLRGSRAAIKPLNSWRYLSVCTQRRQRTPELQHINSNAQNSVKFSRRLMVNSSSVQTQSRRFKGHSKHNTSKQPSSGDAISVGILNYYTRRFQAIVKDPSASTDPKINPVLRALLEEAKKREVVYNTVTGRLETLVKNKNALVRIVVEARALGAFFMCEYYSDRVHHARTQAQGLFKKYGGTCQHVSCSHSFEEKGIITVALHENESIDMDKAEELAIESGAEEVFKAIDDDQREIYRFICDVKEFGLVKTELLGKDVVIRENVAGYHPLHCVPLGETEKELANELILALKESDYCGHIYHNIEK